MSEICVFRPALTAKKAKNGGFLRVCGCFCGRWGAFLGVIGGVKVPKRNLRLDSALFFLSETRTGCRVAGFFVA